MTQLITDKNIKLIFDNLRNLGITALVLASSTFFLKHSAHSQLQVYELVVAIFLFFVGVLLFAINVLHGMEKLGQLPYSTLGKTALIGLYCILALEFIRAVSEFRIS